MQVPHNNHIYSLGWFNLHIDSISNADPNNNPIYDIRKEIGIANKEVLFHRWHVDFLA